MTCAARVPGVAMTTDFLSDYRPGSALLRRAARRTPPATRQGPAGFLRRHPKLTREVETLLASTILAVIFLSSGL
jgi:hypothetical protein